MCYALCMHPGIYVGCVRYVVLCVADMLCACDCACCMSCVGCFLVVWAMYVACVM